MDTDGTIPADADPEDAPGPTDIAPSGRQPRDLAWGLPALVALVLVVTLGASASFQSESKRRARYLRAAQAATERGDLERARIYYEALVRHHPNDPDARYQLAITLDATGSPERAAGLMASLAPTDGTGFGPAHRWLAERWSATGRGGDPQAIEAHLKRWLADEPDASEPRLLMGRLLVDLRRHDEARTLLEAAALTHPEVYLDLARLYALQGNARAARDAAEKAVRAFEDRPADTDPDRAAKIRAARVFLGPAAPAGEPKS